MGKTTTDLEPGTRVKVKGSDIHDRMISMDWMEGRVVQNKPGVLIIKLDDFDWPRTVRPGNGALVEVE